MMETAFSADGTRLAYDRLGEGPPLIMVVGAFNDRATTEPLARALERTVMVFNYDRRGRGDSGDTAPYTIDREIDDVDALIAAAGGSASVFGYSSGALLALRAAARGLAITKLALYEPPFQVDDNRSTRRSDLPERLAGLVAAGRRGDAVELFQREAVGIPEEIVAQLRHAPFRPYLEAIAHTLAYDAAIVGDPSLTVEQLASIATSTLVIGGDRSMPGLLRMARDVAAALPNGRFCNLPGQTHDINPEATAPVLAAFLAEGPCP
jgi:pimeloyl-ACP methyl ester carboxylesterase